MLKIYHNPRCRKSRAGLEYVQKMVKNVKIIDYVKSGLNKEMLEEILLKSNLKPEQLVRTNEEVYKKELKGKTFTRDEWIQILIENPKLLQRPLIVGKRRAVLAQPPEKMDDVISGE